MCLHLYHDGLPLVCLCVSALAGKLVSIFAAGTCRLDDLGMQAPAGLIWACRLDLGMQAPAGLIWACRHLQA
jgi:hypothetical protein